MMPMKNQCREIVKRNVWDSFIEKHAPQSFFQSWDWGDVQKKMGHKLWRYGFYEKGVLMSVSSIAKITAKRGSFLHVRHGPVFDEEGNLSAIKKQLGFFRLLAKEERVSFIRISPLVSDSQEHKDTMKRYGFLPACTHEIDGERCWVLNLLKSEEDLLADMRKTTRYEIRRAEKAGVHIKKTTEESDMEIFLDLYKKTASRQGFVEHHGIAEEFSVLKKENKCLLLLGSFEGNVTAGALIVFYGNQAIYHHGASVQSKIPVSYLVQWEAIKEAKRRKVPFYNFWGVAPEGIAGHPWQGLTLFKKGFGGSERVYMHMHDFPISPPYWGIRFLERMTSFFKGYSSVL